MVRRPAPVLQAGLRRDAQRAADQGPTRSGAPDPNHRPGPGVHHQEAATVKITLEPTDRMVEIVQLEPVPCRVWEGTTDSGIHVYVLVPRIAVHKDDDQTQFAQELKTVRAPSDAAIQVFPMRMVL